MERILVSHTDMIGLDGNILDFDGNMAHILVVHAEKFGLDGSFQFLVAIWNLF
jgi:hypothetical protein